MDNIKRNNFLKNLLLTFVYALFTLIFVFHHEIWADEAQVWVLCRDCSFIELIKLVRIEGHPLLWYFLVFPFAKLLHFPNAVVSMQILGWAFVVAGAGFFVFKSPYNYFLKIAVLISSGFLYWYPIIARSYCLIPLLIFILAEYYKKQDKHPVLYSLILIALANTHAVMYGFCSILAVLFLIKTKLLQNLIANLILTSGLLCVPIYVLSACGQSSVVHISFKINFLKLLYTYKEVVFNIFNSRNILISLIFLGLLIFSSFVFFKKNKEIFYIFVGSIVYQFLIYLFVWGTIQQRAFSIFFLVIFGFWIVYDKCNKETICKVLSFLIVVNLVLTIPNGFSTIKKDLTEDFSGGKKMAEYIRKNTSKESVFLSVFPLITPSVSAYLPDNKSNWKFYYPGYNDFYTYVKYNQTYKFYLPVYDSGKLSNPKKKVYIITSTTMQAENQIPLFESNGFYQKENFKIYQINSK